MNRVTLTELDGNGLAKEEWVFYYLNSYHTLVLDSYYEYLRPTRKHKFRVNNSYNRLRHRDSTMTYDECCDETILDLARKKFICIFTETLKVQKTLKRD